MRHYFLVLLSFFWISGYAQGPFAPSELRASGPIPADFTMDPETRIANAKKKLSEKEKKDKSREEFLKEQSYYLQRLFQGGKVLFGDPATQYVNQIADILLKEDPAIAAKLRFYVVKSPEVNASAFDDGVIFVNAGLIAQAQNEAELAYILAHEITHVLRRHGIEGYSQRSKVAKTRQDLELQEKKFAIFYYSKELETEADKEGFTNFFQTSGYDLKAAYTAFDVLEFSELPFDEIAVDRSLFENEYYKLSKSHLLETLNPISASDRDDEESTHPNLTKRRELMEQLIKESEQRGGSLYLVGEEEFKKVQTLCRNEVIKQQIIDGDVSDAMYNAYALLKQDPNNDYARRMLAYSYYVLARCKVEKKYDKVTRSYKKVQGESQQLHHILSKVSRDELMVIALHQIHKLGAASKDPKDPFYSNMEKDILKDLVKVGKFRSSDFSKVPPGVVDTTAIVLEDSTKSSKYNKIKKKQSSDTSSVLLRFALIDEMQDTAFLALFKKAVAELDKAQRNKYESLSVDDEETESESTDKKKKSRKKKSIQEGETEGINKIVWFDPFYYEFDTRKDEVRRINNFKREQKFFRGLQDVAKSTDIQLTLVNTMNIGTDDVEAYNARVLFHEWQEERSNIKYIPVITSRSFDLDHLAEYYKTDYIAWGGAITARTSGNFYTACFGGICTSPTIITIPYFVYYLFLPSREANAALSVYGLKQNKVVYRSESEFGARHSRVSTLNFFYQEFEKMNKKSSGSSKAASKEAETEMD